MDQTPLDTQPCAATSKSLAGDILYGAEEIALFMYGKTGFRRTVYNLVQQNKLPHFKLGAIICARKSVLLRWIETQEEALPPTS